jgi:hypothetical protein
VNGPADLVEALEEATGANPALEFESSETPELVITAGGTTIRSNLQTWASKLDEAIREDQ